MPPNPKTNPNPNPNQGVDFSVGQLSGYPPTLKLTLTETPTKTPTLTGGKFYSWGQFSGYPFSYRLCSQLSLLCSNFCRFLLDSSRTFHDNRSNMKSVNQKQIHSTAKQENIGVFFISAGFFTNLTMLWQIFQSDYIIYKF